MPFRQKPGAPPHRGAIAGVNDLATLRPGLAAEWCRDAGCNVRGSETVRLGSKHRAWWRCSCGHHWRVRVDARALGGNGCGRCAGQLALPGDATTLAAANPSLYVELDAEACRAAGTDPLTVMTFSNVRVPWLCRHCGHGFEWSPNERAAGCGCKSCPRRKTSAVEQDLRDELRKVWPDVVGQARLPVAWNSGAPLRPRRRNATVDVFLPDLDLAVEYDGLRRHRDPARTAVDLAKTEALLAAGYWVIRVRENELDDLDLAHERLVQLNHRWGTPLEPLVSAIATIAASI